jgi:hypothetical protein
MQKTEMGKRFVRDELSWEKVVSRYEEIYKIYGRRR